MKVQEIYTPGIAWIRSGESLVRAAQAMVLGKHGSLLVAEGDEHLQGILTETDLVHAIAQDVDVRSATVGEHMSKDIKTIDLEADVATAADWMREWHFRHLVVTKAGRVIGMLSMRDIAALVVPDHGRPAGG